MEEDFNTYEAKLWIKTNKQNSKHAAMMYMPYLYYNKELHVALHLKYSAILYTRTS